MEALYKTIFHSDLRVSTWYAIYFAVFFGLWIVIHIFSWLVRAIWLSISFHLLKHLFYPSLFHRVHFFGAPTRFNAMIYILYITINILCLVIRLKSATDLSDRAATMATINLIPLLCGRRLILMTELLGISLRSHLEAHKMFGTVMIAQALLHTVIISVKNSSTEWTWTSVNLSGVVGTSAIGLLSIMSLYFVRRIIYEWFLCTHLIFTIVAVVALWFHFIPKKPTARIFLRIGICLWTILTLIHAAIFLLRNFVRGKAIASAEVTKLQQAMKVVIKVPRPWNVKAGQYIFLTIPAAGITTTFQSHPFMIAWWDRSSDGLTISLLVKPRRGFTGQLLRMADQKLTVFIDGPFGLQHNLGVFGTVVMFATGIGIAGHMPYIKELVSGYNNCEVRTRRIVLIWQLDIESHQQWVKSWMDEIIKMDTGRILEVELYVLKRSSAIQDINSKIDMENILDKHNLVDPKIVLYGTHQKIHKIFASPNIRDILNGEFQTRKGDLVVSVCANSSMSINIRRIVYEGLDKHIRLIELDFQPSLRRYSYNSGEEMDFECRGLA